MHPISPYVQRSPFATGFQWDGGGGGRYQGRAKYCPTKTKLHTCTASSTVYIGPFGGGTYNGKKRVAWKIQGRELAKWMKKSPLTQMHKYTPVQIASQADALSWGKGKQVDMYRAGW